MPGVGGAGSRLLRTVAPCLKRNNSRADTASGAGAAQQPPPTAQNNAGFVGARDGAAVQRFNQVHRAVLNPIHLGFGPEVDLLVQKSPTLCAQLRHVQAMGYQITQAEPGTGSRITPSLQRIYIKTDQSRDDIVSHIAHEVGHALHQVNGFNPPIASKEAYCHARAWDEGGATLNEYKIRDELRKNGENFSTENMAFFDQYFKLPYESFLKHKDENRAKNEMGHFYAHNLTALVESDKGGMESQNYQKIWENHYNDIMIWMGDRRHID
jgi:hypothetical protein